MRIATALLLVIALLALPACRMNERMSGAAFGGIGGAVVGGALGGSLAGGVVGGLAGGVLGYLVGDYLADKRERCSPCAPVQQCAPCPPVQQPCAPPTYAPVQQPCAPSYQPPCAPPTNYPASARYVGGVRSVNPNLAAAQHMIERGRRADTLPEARAAYEQAVRLDPQSADAWNALGMSFAAAGEEARAQDAYRRALALDPHHYAARQNLSWMAGGIR